MAAPLFHQEPLVVTLTIVAFDRDRQIVPPRTKKNSPQIIPGMKHPLLVPSEAYRAWHRGAKSAVRPALTDIRDVLPIAFPVNCRAIFYRDALRGDAVGFYQGLADFLQDNLARKNEPELKVLTDDKWIVSWDGSRLDKDPIRPRIEVELREIR